MRPKENMERFVRVRKPNVTTSPQMDKRTLDDSFAAMEHTIRTKSADRKPSVPGIILRSRMIKLAAAAMIIVAIGLVATYLGPGKRIETPKISTIQKSPAQLMTAAALTFAYRRGGIEAMDEQCEKALERLGPRPLRLTLGQLLADTNG